MKIAITGATGFVGRHVVERLASQGHEILAIGRSAPRSEKGIIHVECDLLARPDFDWIKWHKPSHLLHLAWYAEHGKFWTSPVNAEWCDSTVRLARAFCEGGGKRVVIAGSCAEYDWSFGYCKEGVTPTNPATIYGIAKDCARRLTEEICTDARVPMAWGRIFLPFGRGEDERRIVPSIVRALLGRIPPFEIGVDQWRDLLPVESVADAFAFMLEEDFAGPINVSSGDPVQLAQIIRYAAEVLSKDSTLLLANGSITNNAPRLLVGDNARLLAAGWKPKLDLWGGLHRYIETIAGVQ